MKTLKSKDTIAVAFCALYDDWVLYKEGVNRSFHNLNKSFDGNCIFILCIQGGNAIFIGNEIGVSNYKLIHLRGKGISLARNRCIDEAKAMDCSWILFHDATIYWPTLAAKFIYENRYSLLPPKVKLKFSNSFHIEDVNYKPAIKILNPIYDTYVGAILLNLSTIGSLRFDERHGPGDATIYKSGEDVLFAFGYFSKIKTFKVCEANTLEIYHPPRSNDFKKHKVYARGQGRVFRVLLSKYLNLQLVIDTILFFGNAAFRCVLFKKNSFTILRERIVGFFDEV